MPCRILAMQEMSSAMSANKKKTKVAMVVNIPSPYRQPIYQMLGTKYEDMDFCALFCSHREPDREWDLQNTSIRQVFLKESYFTWRQRIIYTNPDIWAQLKAFKPEVLITTAFNPTFIVAFIYARMHGVKHIAMTDGTVFTESKLSFVHRLVRRWIYGGSVAFIGASEGSFNLYESYGIERAKMFQSHLCANNAAYSPKPLAEKAFDFVFSARFVAMKSPLFAMDVASEVAKRLGRKTRLLLMGSGEEEAAMRKKAAEIAEHVDTVFAGFVMQADLPAHYASAKLFLFPTLQDTWGVVVNEANAAGVPAIVTPMAGVADDLVLPGQNGEVLPLDLERWAQACVKLLSDEALYLNYAIACRERVARYSYTAASDGVHDAVQFAVRAD
jgi:glycosyltransferase involved in cell wall biosynthesis